ncbi:alcohol dehydrogenase catalytic domain-containing protein [Apilactobacillus timberlakei]|uniref:Zinc-binding alcohol dehydrogenase family protein n=1 Tax=Apilactobacillus timberlakei TaxID=2008380 RepID=A0ABY2YRT6_9LACO|nr:zinc-binding alcohol dehydrogenase family protein [Apilactobacillus timberlakei]TPR12317.1 zinc-binding alcohol dehydrogenase family protein [Apilactobacillus timberlakei]TPR12920.1 zinc-binding alcohol dehydrogenase family protein [Apilactobacillus timberlakei]
MKAVALVNKNFFNKKNNNNIYNVNLSGVNLNCGVVDIPKPHFDNKHYKNDNYVLIRVLSFSCNYRDKGIILKSALRMNSGNTYNQMPVSFFGSDFVGIVEEIGKNVSRFNIGDRVIPNCSYPKADNDTAAPGVVTNEASKGWLRINEAKLIAIDDSMDDDIAAGFSIGGQTSESMIRRTHIHEGQKALVLSARSNTSLFIINGLLKRNIDTTIMSTTDWSSEELSIVNGAHYIKISRNSKCWPDDIGKFDVIFDPFFDLHLSDAVKHLNINGRYITCGYKNQHDNFKESTDYLHENNLSRIMIQSMINNLSIMGNCIGTTEDLKRAISKYSRSMKPFRIYDTLSSESIDKFINETYNLRQRFGKVIMKY